MQDIIFKNGIICDGTGCKSYIGDVAVEDGKITKILSSIQDQAKETIDISGLVIAPGFIDMHSHSDTAFLVDERCESKICQGVTTEVAGQCGATIYSCPKDKMDNLYKYVGEDERFDIKYYASSSFKEFLSKVKAANKKMSTNLISLIGHGALRTSVMGFEGRKATEEEMQMMASLLDDDMKSGAWGLSLGLGYAPGVFADQDELNALGHVVKKYDGMVTSHMRDQGAHIFEALDEMYEINRKTNAKVHIAHLKMSGKKQWGRADELIQNIKEAQKVGIKVTADMYPYTAASSGITNVFPKWTLDGGVAKAAQRLLTPERDQIIAFLNEDYQTRQDGEGLYVVTTHGAYPVADDKNIYELSQELGLSMADTIAKVAVEANGNVDCIMFAMADKDVMYLLGQDIAIGSDGYGLPLSEKENLGKPHPRNFGTFPRFLRLARENHLCSLETAVSRMTKMTADILELKDRGVLKEGFVADITIFNPNTITDNATYKNPFMKPTGIEHVIMNGEFAIYNGQQTEKRLGQFILKK